MQQKKDLENQIQNSQIPQKIPVSLLNKTPEQKNKNNFDEASVKTCLSQESIDLSLRQPDSVIISSLRPKDFDNNSNKPNKLEKQTDKKTETKQSVLW